MEDPLYNYLNTNALFPVFNLYISYPVFNFLFSYLFFQFLPLVEVMQSFSLPELYRVSVHHAQVCQVSHFEYLTSPTCSTLTFFLSFAQISLISKKNSALTLSLLFSKIECAPDLHSLIKSALFFHSFFAHFFSNFL